MIDPASLALGIVSGVGLAGIAAFVADHLLTGRVGDLDSAPAAPALTSYCIGYRAESAVRPCVECQGCERWAQDGDPRLPPPAVVRMDAGGHVWCPIRIAS